MKRILSLVHGEGESFYFKKMKNVNMSKGKKGNLNEKVGIDLIINYWNFFLSKNIFLLINVIKLI